MCCAIKARSCIRCAPKPRSKKRRSELDDKKVGALVVLDENGAIIGVFSERDIVREVARRGARCLADTVGAVMSRDVITAHPTKRSTKGSAA